MCGIWDSPMSYKAPVAIRWDMDGNPTHWKHQPAVISVHKTGETSTAQGFILCARKLEITDPELN